MRLRPASLLVLLPLAMGCNLVLGLGNYKDGNGGAGGGTGGSQPMTCGDGKRDGNETDLDCGGSCAPCDPGLGCQTAADCTSKVCSAGSCSQPSCTDTIKNGNESAVDCGGTCPGCGEGASCNTPMDCKSGACIGGTCAPSCTDMQMNGDETGTDCGGSCGKCPNGQGCMSGPDCQSAICVTGQCSDGHLWSKAFGSTSTNYDTAGKVVVGGAGNLILGGTIEGNVDFGGGALASVGADVFVAKLSGTGAHIYSKNYGFTNNQTGNAVTVNTATSDITIGGYYQTSASFGTTVLPGFGGLTDLQFAHFTPNGDFLWAKGAGSAAFAVEQVEAVVTDSANDVITTGTFGGNITLDGVALTEQGNGDLFLFKHGPDGTKKFVKSFGDVSNQAGTSLGTDSLGNIYIAGNNSGSLTFGGAALVSAGGDSDVFLAKLDANGNNIWGFEFGDAQVQKNPEIAVTPNDQIVMAGEFAGTITFGTTVLTSGGPAGNTDIFVARFDGGGNVLWAKNYGDGANQYNAHVAFDDAGNVLLLCTGDGHMDFGGGILTSAGGQLSGPDVFVAKLRGTDGSHVWSKVFGDSHDQGALSIASAGGDDIVFTASFDGTVNFGGMDFTNVGANDFALVRYQTPSAN